MKKTVLIGFLISLAYTHVVFGQTTSKLDEMLNAYSEMHKFNGTALIFRNGKILLNKGYGYADLHTGKLNTANTTFSIASVTKTFTSAMILKLAELHELSLSDKLSKYYPEYRAADRISIANLLSHTSGIDDRTIEERNKKYNYDSISRKQVLLAELNETPLASKPGTRFSYSNRGYFLLGNIIGEVTGMTYEQAIRKYI